MNEGDALQLDRIAAVPVLLILPTKSVGACRESGSFEGLREDFPGPLIVLCLEYFLGRVRIAPEIVPSVTVFLGLPMMISLRGWSILSTSI